MDVMLISRPGVSLLRSLHDSETAWDAIRFYGPVSISIGVYIPVSTLAGAISLTADLRFFLRKFTIDHLFRFNSAIYCTAALTKSCYLTRDNTLSDDWPYRLIYWIESVGNVVRCKKSEYHDSDIFSPSDIASKKSKETCVFTPESDIITEPEKKFQIPTGYLLEVWCTKPEFEMN